MKKFILSLTCLLVFMLSSCAKGPTTIEAFLKVVTSEELNLTMTTTDLLGNTEVVAIDGNLSYVYKQYVGDLVKTESYYVKDSSTTYRYHDTFTPGEWKKDIVLTSGINIQDDFKEYTAEDFTLNEDGSYTITSFSITTVKVTFEENMVTVKMLDEVIVFTKFYNTKVTLPTVN